MTDRLDPVAHLAQLRAQRAALIEDHRRELAALDQTIIVIERQLAQSRPAQPVPIRSALPAPPRAFIWTRYGPEAGLSVDEILCLKESARLAGGGIFNWGIGHSVKAAVRKLIEETGDRSPPVVFSPIRGAPRAVVRWTRAVGLYGKEVPVPAEQEVTSRAHERERHYALVCRLDTPLVPDPHGPRFSLGDLRNFDSGKPLGGQQVTAAVRLEGEPNPAGEYVAAMTARLIDVLELRDPVLVRPAPISATGDRA